MISLESLCFISITKTKDLEPDGATTESTAIQEGKDGISGGANNVHWADLEKCMCRLSWGSVDSASARTSTNNNFWKSILGLNSLNYFLKY